MGASTHPTLAQCGGCIGRGCEWLCCGWGYGKCTGRGCGCEKMRWRITYLPTIREKQKLNNPIEQSLNQKLKRAGIESSDKYQDMFNKCQNQTCRDNVQQAFLRADEESSKKILELYKSGKLTEQEVDVLISSYANKMLDGVQESERKNSGKNDIYSQSGMTWTPAGIGGNPYISEIITRNVITKLYQEGASPETIRNRLEQYQAASKWFNSIETSSQAALLAQTTGMTTQAIITVLTKGKGGKAVANTAHIEKVVAQERNLNLGKQNPRFNEELNKKITNKSNNLEVKHLSNVSKQEFDTIRDFFKKDKINSITHNKNALIKGKLEDLESISIATATVYDKVGKPTHYLAVSGKSWSGEAPNQITIGNKTYSVIRKDNEILPNHNRKTNDGTSIQTNFNHAEKKLMGFITEQNQKHSNISRVEMKIQNTDANHPGACIACGGKNGYQGSIGDFQKRNMNIQVHIEHGSTNP